MKLNIKELKSMIRSALQEQLATGNGLNTVAQGGPKSDEPISEENALTREKSEIKEKSRLLNLALQKTGGKPVELLKFLVKNNSVEWLASTLQRMGIK